MGRTKWVRRVGVVLVTASLLPVSAAVADNQALCGDVQLVWARGTSRVPDDIDVTEANNSLADRFGPGISYSLYQLGKGGGTSGFNYPAAGEGFGFFLEWNDLDFGAYHDSKEAGKQELDAYLSQRAIQCPGELYVLGGWSQGGQVISEGLAGLDQFVRNRIAFVAVFGDPTRNTGFDVLLPAELAPPFLDACNGRPEPWIRGTAPCWAPAGVFGARDPYVPADIANRVGSWCRSGDMACTSLPQDAPSTGVEHEAYFNEDSDAAMAMREAAERIEAMAPNLATDIDTSFLQFATGGAGADLAFVFDTTGSMGGHIDDAKAQATDLASLWLALAGEDRGRVALVEFRDQGDTFVSRLDLPLTNDETAFQTAVNGLVADEGGDTPEAQLSGIMTALNQLQWRNGATKVAVVITDAPGKDPEPVTGFTRAQVSQRALEIDPVAIFSNFQRYRGTTRAEARHPLPGCPMNVDGTPNVTWWAEYRRLNGDVERPPAAGTVNALIAAYKASPQFGALAKSTRTNWGRYLNVIRAAWGNLPVRSIQPRHVYELHASFADIPPADAANPGRHKNRPASADNLLRALSSMLGWSVPLGWRGDNPCDHVKKFAAHEPYRAWTRREIAFFKKHARPELWWVVAHALFTGQRRATC